MHKLVLIRHGESEWNKLNLFTGWTDVELSEKGVQEAHRAGKTLKEKGFDFDVVHTSLLKRAIHTMNNVLFELDREWLPVYKSWRLNERHYGALQGLNKAETAEKYGEAQVKFGDVHMIAHLQHLKKMIQETQLFKLNLEMSIQKIFHLMNRLK